MDDEALTLACLELASHDEHDAYYVRLSVLVRWTRFETVMAGLEQLVALGLAEYVAAKYALTPAGRERLVATRKAQGVQRS
jgi:hypothetical protein